VLDLVGRLQLSLVLDMEMELLPQPFFILELLLRLEMVLHMVQLLRALDSLQLVLGLRPSQQFLQQPLVVQLELVQERIESAHLVERWKLRIVHSLYRPEQLLLHVFGRIHFARESIVEWHLVACSQT